MRLILLEKLTVAGYSIYIQHFMEPQRFISVRKSLPLVPILSPVQILLSSFFKYHWLMNGKGIGRKRLQPNRGIIPKFAWKDCGLGVPNGLFSFLGSFLPEFLCTSLKFLSVLKLIMYYLQSPSCEQSLKLVSVPN